MFLKSKFNGQVSIKSKYIQYSSSGSFAKCRTKEYFDEGGNIVIRFVLAKSIMLLFRINSILFIILNNKRDDICKGMLEMTEASFIYGDPVLLIVYNENLTEESDIPKYLSVNGMKYL